MKYIMVLILSFLSVAVFGQTFDTIGIQTTKRFRFEFMFPVDSARDQDFDAARLDVIDLNSGALHQRFDSLQLSWALTRYAPEGFFWIEDFNFDGYPDFGLQVWNDIFSENCYADYYLYNPQTELFQYKAIGFRNAEGCVDELTNGTFDSVHRVINEYIDLKFYSCKEIHNTYKWRKSDLKLITTDTIYFPSIATLEDLLVDSLRMNLYYGARREDPWGAIFHEFPIGRKNREIYIQAALKYSMDSISYEPSWANDTIFEHIMQSITNKFPRYAPGWLVLGDVLYNKSRMTEDKDGDALREMANAYENYIELMGKRVRKHKVPNYVFDRIRQKEKRFEQK